MNWILARAINYLLLALLAAFILIPIYEVGVGDLSFEDSKAVVMSNLTFENNDIWKRVFTFYLALWCGKAILWALSTASIKQ